MKQDAPQFADTLIDDDEPKSSRVMLDAIAQAQKAFAQYYQQCHRIDAIYSAKAALSDTALSVGLIDQEYDTFWASIEVLKPAIYAKPPKVVAKPKYSDAGPAVKTVAEVMERVVNSEFERGDIDQVMRHVRDDLALENRGVDWVTLESENGKRICVEHLDRLDFLHEPARKWCEVGWVARRAWLTQVEMRKRFHKSSGDAYMRADFVRRTQDDDDDGSEKAGVWEVWSRTDNRVFWVADGVDVMLDDDKPHLNLDGFFPCPCPAYGTVQRRSLIPVPDYRRYERHLDQINVLTSKIYTLLDQIQMLGLVAGGGDVAEAVQKLQNSADAVTIVPVPGAALISGGGSQNLVQWLPLVEIATAIQGLIEARNQLFADFDRLSGISDIMRGETDAGETLGAQRLKSQYGSVRVRDKVDEIVRLSRDTARIAVEIVCDNYTKDDLLRISQMEIPSRREVSKDIEAIKNAARQELEGLTERAAKAAAEAQQAGQEIDPQQAEAMLRQGQQQIAEKYAARLQQLQSTVVIEDVMEIIKDRRDRALAIDIETDSTVLTDQIAEKQMRNELLQAFSGAINSLMPLFSIGDAGVKLGVGMLGFTLQPYTQGNRQIEQLLDDLVEQAPEIAERMAAQQGGGDNEALVEAQKGIAEAEKVKAQAAMETVKSRAAEAQANGQMKFAQTQQQATEAERKHQTETDKLRLQLAEAANKAEMAQQKQQAEIDNLTAQTAKILASIGLDERKQQLSEYTAASNEQARQVDQVMAAQGQAQEAEFRASDAERAERQQNYNEATGHRQMMLAERQSEEEDD